MEDFLGIHGGMIVLSGFLRYTLSYSLVTRYSSVLSGFPVL